MLGIILLLALVLALDSFAVSLGIGAAGLGRSRYLALSLGFGICDGVASFLGAVLDLAPDSSLEQWLSWMGPLAVASYVAYVLLLTKLTLSAGSNTRAGWLVFGLPLCLSLDNLLTGGHLNALGAPAPITAAFFGLCSGLLAFAGLRLAGWMAARWPRPAQRAGLLGLLILALVLCVFQD